MHRRPALLSLLCAAVLTAACDDTPAAPTDPGTTPTEISETFSGTVTVNGASTHPFTVTRAGSASARFASLSVTDAVLGLSLGTWNGSVCQIILANDNATIASVVPGTASAGGFCVRVYDVGKLTGPVDYEVVVTHF